jgi:crotonobetainyl-CoA:carnitine CoA-transferase CaiB-like acyl-CoA transferase
MTASDEFPQPVGPLAGTRVIELGVAVAAPAASGLMADWGADVIKIESPAGDPQRRVFSSLGIGDQSAVPPFELDNRGKKSVILDLRSPDGIDHIHRLLAGADVFVTNMRTAALTRLGLDHTAVLERHPNLVYGSLTAYGLEGPDRDRAGYDTGSFWAHSGIAHTMVPATQLPPPIRSGAGDHTTALALLSGVLAKLLERERTGRGGLVATSLLRAGIYTLGWDIGVMLRFGKRESTRPRETSRDPLVNSYRAGDGRGFWLLLLEGDRHWPHLIAALGSSDLAADDRFAEARARRQNSVELIAALDQAFAGFEYDDLIQRFDAHDVWWAPINSIPDVIVDPQALASGAFVEMTPRDGEAPYRAVNGPVDFDSCRRPPGRVPAHGEHTREVLAQLQTLESASVRHLI